MAIQLTTLTTRYGDISNAVCKITGMDPTDVTDPNVRVNIACYLSLSDLNNSKRPMHYDSFSDTKVNAASSYGSPDVWLQTVDNGTIVSESGIDYSSGTVV